MSEAERTELDAILVEQRAFLPAPKPACADCKRTDAVLRLDMQDTAYGPRCAAVCRGCYEKELKSRDAEGRRFKMRLKKLPAFDKLQECK